MRGLVSLIYRCTVLAGIMAAVALLFWAATPPAYTGRDFRPHEPAPGRASGPTAWQAIEALGRDKPEEVILYEED